MRKRLSKQERKRLLRNARAYPEWNDWMHSNLMRVPVRLVTKFLDEKFGKAEEKATMAKAKFPAKIYVYEVKERDATYYAIANGLEEIPEDQDGQPIATYGLNRQSKFKIKRDLV